MTKNTPAETTPSPIWTPPIFGWQYELTWKPTGSWHYSDGTLTLELIPKESAWALGGFRLVTGDIEVFEPGPSWQKAMPRGIRRFEFAVSSRLDGLRREQTRLATTLKTLRSGNFLS